MKRAFYKRILETAKSLKENYIDQIRTNPRDYTRNRKVRVEDLFLQMLSNKGMSQKNEIHNFYEDVNIHMDVSQTAFYNARMKFNPEALLTIMKDLVSEEYSEPEDLVTLNGYYVMAVDGSEFVLPDTKENEEKYGVASADKYGNAKVMASISTYFDCINKLFLDVSINKYKYPEQKSASQHLIAIQKMIPSKAKYLTIFDRGYVGIRLIVQMFEANQKFLIRLPKGMFTKEQNYLTSESSDQWIDIEYDRARSNKYRNDRKFRTKLLNTKFNLRFVRLSFTADNGKVNTSTFITNLTEEEFDTDGIYELYHLRWDKMPISVFCPLCRHSNYADHTICAYQEHCFFNNALDFYRHNHLSPQRYLSISSLSAYLNGTSSLKTDLSSSPNFSTASRFISVVAIA